MTLEGRRVVKALIGERKNRTFDVRIVILDNPVPKEYHFDFEIPEGD